MGISWKMRIDPTHMTHIFHKSYWPMKPIVFFLSLLFDHFRFKCVINAFVDSHSGFIQSPNILTSNFKERLTKESKNKRSHKIRQKS